MRILEADDRNDEHGHEVTETTCVCARAVAKSRICWKGSDSQLTHSRLACLTHQITGVSPLIGKKRKKEQGGARFTAWCQNIDWLRKLQSVMTIE